MAIYSEKIPFDNQVKAAQEILNVYMVTGINYVLLNADVQSGKTGTYHYLIQQMFTNKLINNAYIVCGSNEIELRNQCINDINEWHQGSPNEKNIHVVFHQDFDKTNLSFEKVLIINDESHLDCKNNQKLHEFLNRYNLSMSGSSQYMYDNNIYILSVDATPFAEESSIAYQNSLPKHIVRLENGNLYYGPQHYYKDGLIHPIFTLSNTEGKENFKKLVESIKNKYILIRIQEKRCKETNNILLCLKELKVPILRFTSHYEKKNKQIVISRRESHSHYIIYKNKIPSLEDTPNETTVVLIDGRLRCGKRVPKKNIGFIWETSYSSKTDTIIQGLLGRMSGYLGDDVYNVPFHLKNRPKIFIPPSILKKSEKKVIELSDFERYIYRKSFGNNDEPGIGPRIATNILPGSVQNKPIKNGITMYACVPIKINLTPLQLSNISNSDDNTIKSYCLLQLLDSSSSLIDNNDNLTKEQKNEIKLKLDTISADDCHIRRYQGTSNLNMYQCHIDAYQNNTVSREHISDYHFITFCVVFPGFKGINSVPGEIFTIFYTKNTGNINLYDKGSRISKHNGKTHFSIVETKEEIQEPCFTPNIISNPEYFENEIINIINFNIHNVNKNFTSFVNGWSLRLSREKYGDKLEIIKNIKTKLETKYPIKIKIIKRANTQLYHEIKSIHLEYIH